MTTPGPPPVERGRRITARQIAAIVIAVLVVVFIVQNRDRVRIELFTLTLSAPLWLLLTVMALLGLIVGLLLGRRRRR
ncbi:MAG TPA: lipopolysaccharide assembly protein LapA domain-containing protein [Pseudonocardia sp.]|nr:lipopolysaccharide assembly protein LapA domain-containing protein [Pseudonocardia sp.]